MFLNQLKHSWSQRGENLNKNYYDKHKYDLAKSRIRQDDSSSCFLLPIFYMQIKIISRQTIKIKLSIIIR